LLSACPERAKRVEGLSACPELACGELVEPAEGLALSELKAIYGELAEPVEGLSTLYK